MCWEDNFALIVVIVVVVDDGAVGRVFDFVVDVGVFGVVTALLLLYMPFAVDCRNQRERAD